MAICPLDSKFGLFKRIWLGIYFSDEAGPTCRDFGEYSGPRLIFCLHIKCNMTCKIRNPQNSEDVPTTFNSNLDHETQTHAAPQSHLNRQRRALFLALPEIKRCNQVAGCVYYWSDTLCEGSRGGSRILARSGCPVEFWHQGGLEPKICSK